MPANQVWLNSVLVTSLFPKSVLTNECGSRNLAGVSNEKFKWKYIQNNPIVHEKSKRYVMGLISLLSIVDILIFLTLKKILNIVKIIQISLNHVKYLGGLLINNIEINIPQNNRKKDKVYK